ncbi:hypothetical protein P8452_71281 [Trifolium repens]|nr:hypothetical protein P8452_71281 [Trifolium repens]
MALNLNGNGEGSHSARLRGPRPRRRTIRVLKVSSTLIGMEKKITLVQTVATAGVFSAISFWYGFMFGRESSRKELSHLIEDLRRDNL